MKQYNYFEAMKADIKSAAKDYYYDIDLEDIRSSDDLIEELEYKFWVDDSVTGNGSGSYTFNSAEAAENISGNLELLCEALEEFGTDAEGYKRALTDPEFSDVTIRCYVMGQVLWDMINEVWTDLIMYKAEQAKKAQDLEALAAIEDYKINVYAAA